MVVWVIEGHQNGKPKNNLKFKTKNNHYKVHACIWIRFVQSTYETINPANPDFGQFYQVLSPICIFGQACPFKQIHISNLRCTYTQNTKMLEVAVLKFWCWKTCWQTDRQTHTHTHTCKFYDIRFVSVNLDVISVSSV